MKTTDRRPWTRFGRRRAATQSPINANAVELCAVSYADDTGTSVIDDVELRLPRGSTTCIVGSSGRDHAALAGLLLGLYRPNRGSVVIDGQDLATRSLIETRSLVAGVLQDPWLEPGSVGDNLRTDRPRADRRGVDRELIDDVCRRTGCDRFIERLPQGEDTPVDELDLGPRRQLALARALLRDPAVLVIEEPTTDLGHDEEREVIRAVDAAREGRTTVILTHRLSLARRADRVLVVEDGRIVAYRAGGGDDGHADRWDTRVPPVVNQGDRPHLWLVGSSRRRAAQPAGGSWNITIGDEFIPGYLASGLLGRSTHIETWVAWSIEREQPVRIKVPRLHQTAASHHPDDPVSYRSWEQLARERRVLDGLDHPGVTRPLDADLDAEMPYLVIEYLDSTSLARVVQREADGMAPLDVLHVGFELAGTLHHLHQRGFVHLNLRAGHVRTRGDMVVITDFTQCRPIGSTFPTPTRPASANRIEQPLFAPEFRRGRPAHPTMDIYALGTLLHRATAGSVIAASPSTAATAGTSTAATAPSPIEASPSVAYGDLADDIPAPMAGIVDQMLSLDPLARPAAGDVLSEFRHILPRALARPRVSTFRTRSSRLRLVSPTN